MPETSLQEARRRFNSVQERVMTDGETWGNFLTCAAHNHKYPFRDQLMIYDQRPDATACADIDLWNSRFDRWINKGTKSVRLLSEDGKTVRHVFDISDTHPGFGHEFDDPPYVWQMEPEDIQDVSAFLKERYNAEGYAGLTKQLQDIAENIAQGFTMQYGLFDEGFVENSLTYYLMTRCGLDPHTANLDLNGVENLIPDQMMTLGEAMNGAAREVLDVVEVIVRENHTDRSAEERAERERTAGWSLDGQPDDGRGADTGREPGVRGVGDEGRGGLDDLSGGGLDRGGEARPAGGLSDEGGRRDDLREGDGHLDAVHDHEPEAAASAADEVRTNETEISGGMEGADSLGDGREPVSPLLPDTGTGPGDETGADDGTDSERPAAGQEREPDGVGTAHEQFGEPGGGDSDQNPDLQLSFDFDQQREPEQLETPSVDNTPPTAQELETPEAPDTPDTQELPVREERAPEVSQTRQNFHITGDDLGLGGAKTKYTRNIAAIRTLKTIEAENRLATPEEQETLSQYVGWGGLPQAFDENNEDWSKEYTELKSLLTDEEYRAARGSTLNAHYTSPMIARSIYETLGRMGFSKGNILEPSCGTGNFFGVLPESMEQSKLYGVELDSITGRIAKQLYQKANITLDGYERTRFQDNFFDVAIGNVPFGSYTVVDGEHKYDRENFRIHDYFFAKTLDKVRPGGVVAFITSKGTLDKANPSVRQYLAQRAELLGAVRLPNNAFKGNAGTEVTTDIIFLQKREQLVDDIRPDWLEVSPNADGIPVNNYFNQHPEMVLGRMSYDKRMYGNENETSCHPIDGANLEEQLKTALRKIQGRIEERVIQTQEETGKTIPADPDVRNFSYTLVDGELYYRENSRMYKPDLPASAVGRTKGMVELRNACRKVINAQMDGCDDSTLKALQSDLNSVYDRFVSRYGRVNDPANAKAFDEDSSYYLICGLENMDGNRRFIGKSDMFTKRTIMQNVVPTSVGTAQEALLLSMSEKARVDMDYMMSLTGRTEEELFKELKGEIFRVPDIQSIMMSEGRSVETVYQTADEYLSGDVRLKLEIAKSYNWNKPDLDLEENIKALEAAQPVPLNATEIDVRLGSTWVPPRYVRQFIHELLQTPTYLKDSIDVTYSNITSAWNVSGKNMDIGNVTSNTTYGTKEMNAYKIIEETLNLKTVKIYTTVMEDGHEKRVLDNDATMLAQQKQEEIKQRFKDWIFQDPDRRELLVNEYNRRFNSTRAREYDGSHLKFGGINPDISLRPHQKDAIARILYGGNTLLAHEVGAGKTYEMVAAAMESKRVGLSHKSLFVVPNHLTEQMATETLRLYPGANVLVATKKDFETKNRKKFCAKIATGDYDAIIIGHSQFEKIPISPERQQRFIEAQIDEITDGIAEAKQAHGDRWSIKQMENSKKNLEVKLEKLQANQKKDDVITFEELGVDRLFVDEAHSFKNLFLYTKMQNVAGISQTEAQKSSDMFMKCRYMDELTGGKGVVFATGTPVSNSMTELYTMQRYLQYDTLKGLGLQNFDAWASTFGETVTALELAPEGTGFRAKTRFSKFFNLPELMKTFKEAADIKTADMLNLPRPKANYHTVSVKPTEAQKELVKGLSERATMIHNKQVKPEEDNMLKITSDGRKIGLDQRLINPLLPDEPGSKVNTCVENVYKIWNDTKDKRLTQLVFCDFSTPGKDKFNVYDDIRKKLIANGVPEGEIAFIHDADTEKKKDELFAKVRSGEVRVLMGSTQKMGAGTNVQDRLIAMHDLDCPWRPADLEQRAGRIVRQGNQNPEVDIYRYVTENTFDAYLYQTIENKQKFISQVMTSRTPLRSCEDVDESVLNYAEVKALCIGDPRIKEKMELDIDVNKLKLLEASYKNQQYALQDKLRNGFPNAIAETERKIDLLKQDTDTAESTKEAEFKMTLMGKTYGLDEEGKPQKKEAAEALLATAQTFGHNEGTVGEYRGFKMSFYLDSYTSRIFLNLQGATTHNVEMGESAEGNLTRLNNAIDGISKRLESAQAKLENIHEQIKTAEEELKKPFARADELKEKSARLAELNIALTMPEKHEPAIEDTPTPDSEDTEQVKDIHEVEQPDYDNAVNFRGIPANSGPVSEQEVRNLNLIPGNPNIYLHPRKDGQQYRGEVVHVDTKRGFCVQQIGKQSLFCHDLKDLERMPTKGENIKLAYPREDGRKAAIVHQEEQSRTQARVYA